MHRTAPAPENRAAQKAGTSAEILRTAMSYISHQERAQSLWDYVKVEGPYMSEGIPAEVRRGKFTLPSDFP